MPTVGTLAYDILLDVGEHLVLVLKHVAGVVAAYVIVSVTAAGTVEHGIIVTVGHVGPHATLVVEVIHLLEREGGTLACTPGLVGDYRRA